MYRRYCPKNRFDCITESDDLNIFDTDYNTMFVYDDNNKTNNDKDDDNHKVPESTIYYADFKNKNNNLCSGYLCSFINPPDKSQ